MKRKWTKIFVLLFVFSVVLISFVGCLNPFMKHPHEFINVKWVSTEPEIEFETYEFNSGAGFGYVVVNGQKQKVFCHFPPAAFEMLRVDETGTIFRDVLIEGTYITKSDVLIIDIETDNIFEGKYKEISLTAYDIDISGVSAEKFINVMWGSLDPHLYFKMAIGGADNSFNMKVNTFGYVKYKGVQRRLTFEWQSQNRFAIFLLKQDGTAESVPAVEGTYQSKPKSAVLKIEKDLLFDNAYPQITIYVFDITLNDELFEDYYS